MKFAPKSLVWFLTGGIFLGCFSACGRPTPDAVIRQKLVQTILSEGQDQQKLLNELAESGAKIVHDVLTAWTRDGVFLYDSPDGSKVPILLDDQQDSEGKARAIRIVDGQFLKDAKGKELRFASADLNNVETDMRLRSSIQQSMDTLALAAANPEERNSAVLKLGNSQKPRYIPILQARLAKESNVAVRRSLDEAIALLQLADPDPKVEITAVQHLAELKSIGSLDNIKKLMNKPGCPGDVANACRHAANVIDNHISFVNFIGTIFHGLSLGSILLVVALGLAITFGLMGIINMAHGEMIAVGAYTCYVVQNIFGSGFGFSITLPIQFRRQNAQFRTAHTRHERDRVVV